LSNVTVDNVTNLKTVLISTIGATSPSRDSVDTRVLGYVSAGAGGMLPTSQTDVGGWPTLAAGTAPTDTDGDGMPDTWEQANGTNYQAADADGYVGSSYTNIERWINSFFESSSVPVLSGVSIGGGVTVR
jgi:hypothetical protein